jgi:hypothetical protein
VLLLTLPEDRSCSGCLGGAEEDEMLGITVWDKIDSPSQFLSV